jgi:hypothetical protein
MCSTTVCVCAHQEIPFEALVSCVVGIGQVPVTTDDDTTTIRITGMVASRPHVLLSAGIPDTLTLHLSFHLDSRQSVPTPFDRGFEALSSLDTESVAISIPVPAHPLVSFPSVHQRPMAMATSVEESTLDLLHWYSMPTIVVWMREVPVASNHVALAISIVGMIADRPEFLSPAGLVNVLGSHISIHFNLLEVVSPVCEAPGSAVIECAKRLTISIIVV